MAIITPIMPIMNFTIDTSTDTIPTSTRITMSGCKRPLCRTITSDDTQEPLHKKQRTKAHNKKRVRFGHEHVHEVARVEATDVPSLWYSPQEYYHNRRCDAHWVSFYTHCDDSYKQQLFQVLGVACGKAAPARDPLVALADSQMRGLEREMTPCFRQRKRQVVANVLQSQAALTAWKNTSGSNKCAHKGAEILAAHYRKLALPAARFARLLAQGDALLAQASSPSEPQR